jgi:hypothetical protein
VAVPFVIFVAFVAIPFVIFVPFVAYS